MSSMAVVHRQGMDFCGDHANFDLALAGTTLEDAKNYCSKAWGGPCDGDIAVLKDGLYYVSEGTDYGTDTPFTKEQLDEIVQHFDEGAVTFL